MKNLITLFLVMCSVLAFAQGSTKNDIIFTKDGQLIQAKVVKVTATTISFNYPGETVINEVEKSALEKIVFASGRTQTFGKGASTPTKKGETVFVPAEKPGPIPKEEIFLNERIEDMSIAVVPASFNKNGNYSKELSSELSSYITTYLAKKSAEHQLKIQDMTKTIRSLVDNGIGYQELKSASIGQLRNALGTEFLLKIEVEENQNKTTAKAGGFFDDAKETVSGNTKTTIHLKVYGMENDNEIHMASMTYEQMKPTNNWQALSEYMIDQFIALKSL